jgi:hypothetical protein
MDGNLSRSGPCRWQLRQTQMEYTGRSHPQVMRFFEGPGTGRARAGPGSAMAPRHRDEPHAGIVGRGRAQVAERPLDVSLGSAHRAFPGTSSCSRGLARLADTYGVNLLASGRDPARPARAHPRAAAAALAIAVLFLAGCGGGSSHPAAPHHPPSPCAQLAALSPGLAPVLAGLGRGGINLTTSQPARRQLLRFTGDAATWAAATGATAFTTLFRHLRHLWNWPPGLIPELAHLIRRDIAAADAHCATAHNSPPPA